MHHAQYDHAHLSLSAHNNNDRGKNGMADLILLHGGEHGSWCWEPLLKELDKGPFGRILALDMPGCGSKRGRDTSELTQAQIARELNDDVRAAGIDKGILLGHSIAGVLLPQMVIDAPELYSRLLFLATCVPGEGQSVMEQLGSSLHGEDPEHVGWPVDPATSTPEQLSIAMFGQDLSQEQLGWLLGEVAKDHTPPAVALHPVTRAGYAGRVPASFILTLRDNILPAAWQRRFAERAGCTEIIEIDTPHEPFMSHPALLAKVLRSL
jgi:pimeloyl-ACP methyl ester carboxylesterase